MRGSRRRCAPATSPRALVEATRRGEARAAHAWSYPRTYLRTEGAAFAALDALRVHFLRFSDGELEAAFARGLVSHRDLLAPFLDAAIPAVRPLDALGRGLRGATHPRILGKLLGALAAAHRVKRLYQRVPATYGAAAIAGWERSIRREVAHW